MIVFILNRYICGIQCGDQNPLKKTGRNSKSLMSRNYKINKMKKIIILSCILLSLFSLNSCITMHSVSISDVKPSTGTEVNCSVSGLGFLHLGVPKGLAEKATYELKNKGAVGNVSTVLTMREWGIVQFYKVTAKGITEPK